MLESRDIKSAAQLAKVGEATLHRWMKDDAFVAELRRREGDLIDQTTRRLLRYQEGALAVVVGIMADKDAPASVRLRAAGMIFDTTLRFRELRNVEDRLANMEAMIEGMNL